MVQKMVTLNSDLFKHYTAKAVKVLERTLVEVIVFRIFGLLHYLHQRVTTIWLDHSGQMDLLAHSLN